jgi:hypothetical protein
MSEAELTMEETRAELGGVTRPTVYRLLRVAKVKTRKVIPTRGPAKGRAVLLIPREALERMRPHLREKKEAAENTK